MTNSDSRAMRGWGFWLIYFSLLLGPCWYLGDTYRLNDRTDALLPWAIGLPLAALGACVLSLAVNFLLKRHMEFRQERTPKRT